MTQPIAFAVFITTALAAAGALAACPAEHPKTQTHPAKPHPKADNCVDLGAVPQISSQIVEREPTAPIAKTPYTLPTSAQYEGPTLGMTKPDPGVKPTPTIGYHWSLE
jgi:hypothetical protein